MFRKIFEVHCMMCGSEVGEIREGRFVHHRGCERTPPVRRGILRCCRCGGSLYKERADSLTLSARSYALAGFEAPQRLAC
jgi:hypothetical protein